MLKKIYGVLIGAALLSILLDARVKVEINNGKSDESSEASREFVEKEDYQNPSDTTTPLLISAIKQNDNKGIEELVREGADVNDKDIEGKTALHHAVLKKNVDVVAFLIDQGAELEARDIYGKSPLAYAKALKNKKIIRLLQESGAIE